jgi:hypothetical protein
MLPVRLVSPTVTVGLAVISTLAMMVSPLGSLCLMAALILGLAVVDGRPRTAVALLAGWALQLGLALVNISMATQHLPDGTRSHAGLAFMVLPWLFVAMALVTALVFGAGLGLRARWRPAAR